MPASSRSLSCSSRSSRSSSADEGVVFAHDVAKRPSERHRRSAAKRGDVALAVASGHDAQRADAQVAIDLPVRDGGPGHAACDRVERLAELLLLVDGEVRRAGRPRDAPDDVVVVLERDRPTPAPARRSCAPRGMRFGAAPRAAGSDAGPGARGSSARSLDRRRRQGGSGSSGLVRRSLARQVADLEGETSIEAERAKDLCDPILVGLVESQLERAAGVALKHGEVGAVETSLVVQVGEHSEVGAGIRRVDKPEAIALLRVRLERELRLDERANRSPGRRRRSSPRPPREVGHGPEPAGSREGGLLADRGRGDEERRQEERQAGARPGRPVRDHARQDARAGRRRSRRTGRSARGRADGPG